MYTTYLTLSNMNQRLHPSFNAFNTNTNINAAEDEDEDEDGPSLSSSSSKRKRQKVSFEPRFRSSSCLAFTLIFTLSCTFLHSPLHFLALTHTPSHFALPKSSQHSHPANTITPKDKLQPPSTSPTPQRRRCRCRPRHRPAQQHSRDQPRDVSCSRALSQSQSQSQSP